ncbi:MAG: VWA domain-containing protein [Thermodesulfovibrionales bacterium]|nr:VWA domain-containing protein [Thermodesulfovibrionales bacterium]
MKIQTDKQREQDCSIIWPIIVAVAVWGAFIFAMINPAHAAGLLIADGGFGGRLEVKEHRVDVKVNNGVVVTKVTQVFKNMESRQVEALYTFPVPRGASVSNFSMWINGAEMVGEVLEKQRAREIYNSYKQVRRDPGLLEQKDYKTFEMRIFPIAAGAEQKVEITYYQELEFDHDMATYVYPLDSVSVPGVDPGVKGTFGMNVEMVSAVPIVLLESTSHPDDFVMLNHSDNYAQASLETAGGSLARDVVLHFGLKRPRTGMDLVTSNVRGDDGYFMMTITAGEELSMHDMGMDYVFVLDVSGSMGSDRKLAISQDSLEAFIRELGPDDRFELMIFNLTPETLFGQLARTDEGSKQSAYQYLASQEARGGTNLAPAMRTAYKYANADRALNVVVLSDGMTEQGERAELLRLIQSRPASSRVFCIGIGNEVNKPLLEQVAQDSGGLAAFISRGDDFQRQAKAFRRKLMRPAITDIELSFDGIRVYDVEPAIVPNLFYGSPVRIYGRYSGGKEGTVKLDATILGKRTKQEITFEFPKKDETNPEIERMWALKRVDSLLKKADRSGDRGPVKDEIVRLGEGYSIVTEYTSFLVLENDEEYRRWKIERRNEGRIKRDRQAQAARERQLTAMRNNAMADLGPEAVEKIAKPAETDASRQAQPANRTQNPPQNNFSSRDFSPRSGSGPVGPAFVVAAWLMSRMRRRK